MSKMGNFVVEMHLDAREMTKEEFVNKYGAHNSFEWERVRFVEPEPDSDPFCYPGSDPQE